jgi:inositol-phosphate phosphatase / L-galactose 1-phosphate phosphatase / histidinol-phosphatase
MGGTAVTPRIAGHLVAFALELADIARRVALAHSRTSFHPCFESNVAARTQSDRMIEEECRQLIKTRHPSHGVLGKQFGCDLSQAFDCEYVWVLDPIDRARALESGKPRFSSLIGLLRHGEPVLGVLECSPLHEQWVEGRGWGTLFNGQRTSVRHGRLVRDAMGYTAGPKMFANGLEKAFTRVYQEAKLVLYDADSYAFGLLASGQIDFVVQRKRNLPGYCALVPIVKGAGGAICSWDGTDLGVNQDGSLIAASTPRLCTELVGLIRS